jgi:nucleoid-associated protein
MGFELKFAIIHGFEKEARQTYVKKVIKKTVVLDNDLVPVLDLVQGVANLLGKPGNILSYGQFGDDMRQGKFPAAFDNYSNSPLDEATFIALSHTAVDELAHASQSESFSTGGHILVAFFMRDSSPFLLVAMIKKKGAVTLDVNYVPIAVTEIDLTKVHQAARISIARYLTNRPSTPNISNDEDEQADDRTYLSFVGQGTHNNASGYFVNALGCTKGISSSRATNNAITGVRDFFAPAALRPFRSASRNATIAYLRQQSLRGHNAKLNDLVYAALSVLEEGIDELVEPLKNHLNGEKVKVPSEFAVHEKTVIKKSIIKGGAESANWTVQFEQSLLGTKQNATVVYDQRRKSLTFTELSAALIADIEAELGER